MFYIEVHDLFAYILLYQNKMYNIITTLKIEIICEYDVPILL